MPTTEKGFITRGVTVVDWPWIPNKEVKDIIGKHCRDNDYSNDTTTGFDSVIESLEDEAQYENKPELLDKVKVIKDFLVEYDLKEVDSIRYWW